MSKVGCKVTFLEEDVNLHSTIALMTTLVQSKKESVYLLNSIHPCISSPSSIKLAYHTTFGPFNACSKLRHYRLGHTHLEKLSMMQQLKMVHGFCKLALQTIDF